jgi:hypothetical protein
MTSAMVGVPEVGGRTGREFCDAERNNDHTHRAVAAQRPDAHEIFATAMAEERTLGGDAPQGSPARGDARMQPGGCSADGVCGAAAGVNNAARGINQEARGLLV